MTKGMGRAAGAGRGRKAAVSAQDAPRDAERNEMSAGALTGTNGRERHILSVTFDGEPVPKQRPRVWKGRARTPQRTVDAEKRIGWLVKAAIVGDDLPTDDLIRLRLVFRSAYSVGNGRTADLDNCVKLVMDALNGVVWADDRQVYAIEAVMHRLASESSTTVDAWALRDEVE